LLPWRNVRDNILLPLEIVAPHRARFRKDKSTYVARADALLALSGWPSSAPICRGSFLAGCSSARSSAGR
jgi:ABC-type nitrate/sulfonate/bicarbonate transport system ATPase subunit